MSVNATTTGTKKAAAATQQAAPAAAQQQTNQQAGAAFMPVFGLQTCLSAFGSGGEQFEKLFENISNNPHDSSFNGTVSSLSPDPFN